MIKQRICRIAVSTIPARSFVAIALVVLLASSFAAASTPQGHFEKTFQVSGAVDLEVQTRSGDIIVRNCPAESVLIQGKIYVVDHLMFGNRHTAVSELELQSQLQHDGYNNHITYVIHLIIVSAYTY